MYPVTPMPIIDSSIFNHRNFANTTIDTIRVSQRNEIEKIWELFVIPCLSM